MNVQIYFPHTRVFYFLVFEQVDETVPNRGMRPLQYHRFDTIPLITLHKVELCSMHMNLTIFVSMHNCVSKKSVYILAATVSMHCQFQEECEIRQKSVINNYRLKLGFIYDAIFAELMDSCYWHIYFSGATLQKHVHVSSLLFVTGSVSILILSLSGDCNGHVLPLF